MIRLIHGNPILVDEFMVTFVVVVVELFGNFEVVSGFLVVVTVLLNGMITAFPE